MRCTVVGVLCVVALVCVCAAQPSRAGDWNLILGPVLEKIVGLWHNGEVDFMGHRCYSSRRPTIRRWELYYKGKFWCPGWAPFSGSSMKQSPSGATEHATRDFVRKAFERGLISEKDAELWLKNRR